MNKVIGSKSVNQNCVEFVDCPKCGQQKTIACKTPSGRKTASPHGHRVAAYYEQFVDQQPALNVRGIDFLKNLIDARQASIKVSA